MHRYLTFLVLGMTTAVATADEGLWLLNQPPTEMLRAKYGFVVEPDWIEHVQKSCVRISSGGSGSFVSPHGLIMTNHHVGSDAIADLSTDQRDLMATGFLATSHDQELKCPNLKVYQLISIEDITARVNAQVTPDMEASSAQAARDKTIAALEKSAQEDTGLQPEVVKLYHGARYHLYSYKVYDDIRLVMAPESAIGFFGGDIDNFEYPRYNLDVCFFRAYDAGSPVASTQHFSWSAAGPNADELIFMAGHPARTRRSYTARHLEFLRDVELPMLLHAYNQKEVALSQFVLQSAENARVGKEPLLGVQNGRKAFQGILDGLLDPRVMQHKRAQEAELRSYVAQDPSRIKAYGGAWSQLEAALDQAEAYYVPYYLLENRRSGFGRLHGIARTLVRVAAERDKPNGARLREYRDTQLKSLEGRLFSPVPIHDALEHLQLTDGLTRLARFLGGDHPVVRAALGGMGPGERAAQVLSTTRLKDVAYRRQLWERGQAAVDESNDPLIEFVKAIDPLAREFRAAYEQGLASISTAAYARIAQARFDRHGEAVYPDATYSLRLSIGTVQGYSHRGGQVPAMTRMSGAFEHAAAHDHQPPFKLPESWMKFQSRINGETPFNFISTHDIIGGNSGSPVFNRKAQIVGIVFDGNIQSLIWDVQFDDRQARSVSVHSSAILEALKSVYSADALVRELKGQG